MEPKLHETEEEVKPIKPTSKADKQETKLLREKWELHFERMKAELKEWGIDLEIMSHRAHKASHEVRAEYHKQVEAMRPPIEEAKKRLKLWQKEGGDVSEELLKGVEKAWAELRASFEAASAKVKEAEKSELTPQHEHPTRREFVSHS